MLRLASLFLAFFLAVPTHGQTVSEGEYSLSGVILDALTGDPLDGSHVLASSGTASTIADQRGRFDIHLGVADTALVISHVGYESLTLLVIDRSVEWISVELHRLVLPIPEIVVEHVSIHDQPTAQTMAMGSSHRVTARDLERYGTTDPGRALRSVPGLNIQEEDGFGLRPNIGIRGTGAERSSRITVMEDGILAAPAPYAAPSAYYFPNTARMSGIEVRKGASQIKYGPYTTGGALNLVSRPLPAGQGLEVNYTGGSEAYRSLHTIASAGTQFLKAMVELSDLHSRGFKKLDNLGDTGFRKTDLVGKVRWSFDDNGRVKQALLLKALASYELSNETYLGLTSRDFNVSPFRRYLGSARDNMDADYRQVSLRHVIEIGSNISIRNVAYRSLFERNWYKLDKVTSADGKSSISTVLDNPAAHPHAYDLLTGRSVSDEDQLWVKANNRSYLSQGVSSEVTVHGRIGRADTRVEAGLRLHQDEMDRFQWVDGYTVLADELQLDTAGVPGSESNRIESASALSGYLQPTVELGRIAINAGVRHERIRLNRDNWGTNDPERLGSNFSQRANHVSVWIPGMSASLQLNDRWTFFSGIHRGFSPPGSAEGSDPERSVNVDSGIRMHRGLMRFDLIGFNNEYSNLLGADVQAAGGSGSGDLFNGGKARVRGVEGTASFNLGSWADWKVSLPFHLTYAFTDASFQSSFESDFDPWGNVEVGHELPYVARHTGTIEGSIEGARFDVSLRASLVSSVRTESGLGAIPVDRLIPRHTVLDLGGGWDLSPATRLFISVRNVTNSVYIAARRPSGLRPGLPRMITMGRGIDLTQ